MTPSDVLRVPLRPLARILKARARGENTEAIARENLRKRQEAMQTRARARAESRLLLISFTFFLGFGAIGVEMAKLASTDAEEPRAETGGNPIIGQRADIVDRNGRILATNLDTYALYAQPQEMVDPLGAAQALIGIFPEMDLARLQQDFTGSRRFLWVRRQISPEQMQAVHDIGDPGLLFGPREMRLYPNGPIAAHILGGASYGREGVNAAEVIGVAGIERQFDAFLRDPANEGAPLQLSLDLTVQAAMEEVLSGGMALMNARGAAAVILDVRTGEVLAMASLPDFDPNSRPAAPTSGDPSESPLFNRAVQGVYELGSVFKIFTIAAALEAGLVSPETVIDIRGPLTIGRFRIRDFSNYGTEMSVSDVIAKSSNIGTGRIALELGAERLRSFLGSIGLLEITPLEIPEAVAGRPLFPAEWSNISIVTISYGQGIATSPAQLAAAYASVVNGGTRVTPTLLRQDGPVVGPRVLSETVSRQAMAMLRRVVTYGTASLGEVEGYEVGGKTGTADKPSPSGGYYADRVIATFAGAFPASDPRYVVIVTLDEPVETSGSEPRRTAGWTSVPVAAELIRRTAPLLGLRPEVDVADLTGVTMTINDVP